MKRLGGGEIHHPLSRGMDEKGCYLLPWMDQRFIQRHFYLKLQGIHRSCSSKIYYWHHQFGGAIIQNRHFEKAKFNDGFQLYM